MAWRSVNMTGQTVANLGKRRGSDRVLALVLGVALLLMAASTAAVAWTLNGSVQEARQQVAALGSRVERLENESEAQQGSIANLTTEVEQLQAQVEALQDEVDVLQGKVDDLASRQPEPPWVLLQSGPGGVAAVAIVTRAEPLTSYTATLYSGTTRLFAPATVRAGLMGSGGGLDLSFSDYDAGGTLNSQDSYTATGGGTNVSLVLHWKATGVELARIPIQPSGGGGCGVVPTMSWTGAMITPGSPGGDDWEFRVASIDSVEDFGCYRVLVLEGSSTVLGPSDLFPASPLLGTPDTLHLNFTDLDGGGTLTGGDTFILGNAAAGTIYHIVILWKDSGNEISRKTILT